MSTPFLVRRYSQDDFEPVAALAVLASSAPETACGQPDVASVNEFAADYGHRNLEAEAWVAVDADGQVIGFSGGQLRTQTLTVDGPIVDPAWQRRGIGRALFAQLEADACEQGALRIEAGVRATNTHGRAFLEQLGYGPSREIYCYEAPERRDVPFELPPGYRVGELKPKYLVPFLMIMHECFPGYRLPSTPQRLFEPDKMNIFLVHDPDDRPVAAATAFFYPGDRLGYVYHLGVSEPARRLGLARALLSTTCGWLWDKHDPVLIGLSTSDEMGVRHRLYEPAGFGLRYALTYRRKDVAAMGGSRAVPAEV